MRLGHSHPDFTYPNDVSQARAALYLSALAAIVISILIIAAVLH